MKDVQLCREILSFLYDFAGEHGHSRFVPAYCVRDAVDAPHTKTNHNVICLEQEGYLRTIRTLGTTFVAVRIEPPGRELLESEPQMRPMKSERVIRGIASSDLDPEVKDLLCQVAMRLTEQGDNPQGLRALFGELLARITDADLARALSLLAEAVTC
jgi:hypothetical protein